MSRTKKNIDYVISLLQDYKRESDVCKSEHFLNLITFSEYFDFLFEKLNDEESKTALDWFIKFSAINSAISLAEAQKLIPPKYTLDEYNELKAKISTLPENVIKDDVRDTIEIWNMKSYTIPGVFEALSDDVIIDGGAYTGNSSIYYAEKAKQVFAFEGAPSTYKKLVENVNKFCDGKVIPENKALYSENTIVRFDGESVDGQISNSSGCEVQAVSIDNYVNDNAIDKIDLIKLDVEGAELDVLKGAINTIKKCEPKLAISAYHKPSDLIVLTNYILNMGIDYDLYLRAETIDMSNIILFCVPTGTKNKNSKVNELTEIQKFTLELMDNSVQKRKKFIKDISILREQREASSNEVARLREQRETSNKEIAKLREQRETSNKEITKLREQRETSNNEIARLREQREASNNEVARLREQREASNNEVARLREQRETSNKEVARLREQREASNNEIKVLKNTIETLENRGLLDYIMKRGKRND